MDKQQLSNMLLDLCELRLPKSPDSISNRMLDVWGVALADVPDELAYSVSLHIIRNSNLSFFPTPAQFREIAHQLCGKVGEDDEMNNKVLEAWKKFKNHSMYTNPNDYEDKALVSCIKSLYEGFGSANVSDQGQWFAKFRDMYKSMAKTNAVQHKALGSGMAIYNPQLMDRMKELSLKLAAPKMETLTK